LDTGVPDLMITDYSMPEMTGLELVGHVRNLEVGRTLQVIMLTARGQDLESWGPEPPRIDLLLNKPFSPREVLTKAEELLGVKT
ncbi:MAG: response regulator, partial [Planctomycetes bacterium]|nr:response regulator [Planctomycetota bacterium]